MLKKHRNRALWLVMAVALWLVPAGLRAFTVNDVPNVHVQDARQYVSDPSGILSATARDSINLMLARLEKSTGIQGAVVMLPTIGDADIFNFAHELFRQWGIGQKDKDNGWLLLFVMDQRKVRTTTGYGLEGTLTDALCKRIQQRYMVPRFKVADWDGGVTDGVRQTVLLLDGTMTPGTADDEEDAGAALGGLLVAMLLVAVLAVYMVRKERKCPRCGRQGLRQVHEQQLRVALPGGGYKRVRRKVYVCKYCGERLTRDEDMDNGPDAGTAVLAGAAMRDVMRSAGGGSFGGTFGGGSTGGGGSTSGW